MSPIRRENKTRYPRDWNKISRSIRRERAGDQCECTGECRSPRCMTQHPSIDRCGATNHAPHPVTGAYVVLTVAHLDHTPENCDPDNLRVFCQLCHLAYDRDHHRRTRRRTLLAAETDSMNPLFDGGELG